MWLRIVEPGCQGIWKVVMFGLKGIGAVTVGDEVGSIRAEGEFYDVFNGRALGEKSFDIRWEIMPKFWLG